MQKHFINTPKDKLTQRKFYSEVEKAIKRTLAYRSIFNYPLNFYQLSTYLITDRRIGNKALRKELKKLEKKGQIKTENNLYTLHGVKNIDWKDRKNSSTSLIDSHKYVFDSLKKIPWIKFIGITGATAAFNAHANDDIDIFIISQRKRLWITRLFTTLILKSLKKYRTDKDPVRKICPNIFIDEDNVEWDKSKQGLYVAHEILMMHPLYDKDNTYFKFIKKNSWVFNYLSNCRMDINTVSIEVKNSNASILINVIEKILMKIQLLYMKRKITEEIATKNIIHFNKNDWSHKVLNDYSNILKKFNFES